MQLSSEGLSNAPKDTQAVERALWGQASGWMGWGWKQRLCSPVALVSFAVFHIRPVSNDDLSHTASASSASPDGLRALAFSLHPRNTHKTWYGTCACNASGDPQHTSVWVCPFPLWVSSALPPSLPLYCRVSPGPSWLLPSVDGPLSLQIIDLSPWSHTPTLALRRSLQPCHYPTLQVWVPAPGHTSVVTGHVTHKCTGPPLGMPFTRPSPIL